MAYAVYSKSSLHGNCYKLNTVNSSLNYLSRKLCLTSYTFTPHLIMDQVFYGTDPAVTHVTSSHLSTHLTHDL